MIQITVTRKGMQALGDFRAATRRLQSGRWKQDAMRGVIDAGRRTKVLVSKSVAKQIAIGPGKYGSHVVRHMRQSAEKENLAFRIFAVRGGQDIEAYKGFRILRSKASQKRQAKDGRSIGDIGTVGSEVWNEGRIFKRSFVTDRGVPKAFLPPGARGGHAATIPASMWTFGAKVAQPRDALGRFAASGVRYGKSRRLYGGSLRDEIGEGKTLATFQEKAPALLQEHVMKRLEKLLDF